MMRARWMTMLALGLLAMTFTLRAHATEPWGVIPAFAGVITIGWTTLACTAEVLGDTYETACTDVGGEYVYQGDGKPWACVNATERPDGSLTAQEKGLRDQVRECVQHYLGPVVDPQ